jgi:hypothetical protein
MDVPRATSSRPPVGEGRHIPPWRALAVVLLLVGVAVVLLVRPAASAVGSFPDVPATHPYYAAIMDLAGRGVVQGYTNGNFGPVKRQQLAKMIVLSCGYPVSAADASGPVRTAGEPKPW